MSSLTVLLLLLSSFVAFASSDDIPLITSTSACTDAQPQKVKETFGYIISPGFDAFHFLPGNLNCSWIIHAPEGEVVNFRFIRLLFGSCKDASLEIYDGTSDRDPILTTACDRFGRNRFRSKGNSLFLKLRSSANPNAQGYQAYFDHSLPAVSCEETQVQCQNQEKCFMKSDQCNKLIECSDGTDEEDCEHYDTSDFKCGESAIQPDLTNDRIVGGKAAVPNSWPWQASMRLLQEEPQGHQCGATLINRKWLVTAAHCFRNVRDSRYWIVLLGKHRKLVRDNTEQLRYIKSIIIHPNYKGLEPSNNLTWLQKKESDIALVKLSAPVLLNSYVQAACLPSKDRYIGPANFVFTLGWGITEGTGFELYLKQALVTIVPRTICQILYPYYQIGDNMLCAGYMQGGHDACSGDSGGPLLQMEPNGTWTLIGVTSTGGICGAKKEPGIYTEVSKYVDWIREVTTEK